MIMDLFNFDTKSEERFNAEMAVSQAEAALVTAKDVLADKVVINLHTKKAVAFQVRKTDTGAIYAMSGKEVAAAKATIANAEFALAVAQANLKDIVTAEANVAKGQTLGIKKGIRAAANIDASLRATARKTATQAQSSIIADQRTINAAQQRISENQADLSDAKIVLDSLRN